MNTCSYIMLLAIHKNTYMYTQSRTLQGPPGIRVIPPDNLAMLFLTEQSQGDLKPPTQSWWRDVRVNDEGDCGVGIVMIGGNGESN